MAGRDTSNPLYSELSPAERELVLLNLNRYFDVVFRIFLRVSEQQTPTSQIDDLPVNS